MAEDYFNEYRIGGYRLGVNLPMKGAVWENVAKASRWGAPVIEINAAAESLGSNALQVVKEMAQANDLKYTWHIPPDARQSGELAVPDERSNELARNVFKQAIKASMNVGAKHITFHPTLQASRPTEDAVYGYNVAEKKISGYRVPEGMSSDETIKMYDESAKAQVQTQLNGLNNSMSFINQLEKISERIEKRGVDREKVVAMKGIMELINNTSSTVKVIPPDIDKWDTIRRKVDSNIMLTPDDERVVKNLAKNVKSQIASHKVSVTNSLKQLEPVKKIVQSGKDLVLDGEDYMKQTVADNFGKMVDEDRKLFENAMSQGLSVGIENLPGNTLFSTPEEMDDIRDKIVDKLVEKGFSRKKAEDFVGFTFDLSHANTIKYMDIKGKRYTSPGEFPEKLRGPIKHVHLSDTVGAFDAHLPIGQGELAEEEVGKMKKALEKSGFKGTSVHELGGTQTAALYQASMAFIEPGMYSVGEVPTSSQWGPGYLAASMTDPLVFSSKEKGYFYETFGEIF